MLVALAKCVQSNKCRSEGASQGAGKGSAKISTGIFLGINQHIKQTVNSSDLMKALVQGPLSPFRMRGRNGALFHIEPFTSISPD